MRHQLALSLLGLALALAAPLGAQQIPQRPQGMTDQQIQQQIQVRGLGDLLRQRIQQSGLTPDQIRARLRSAGYSENLIDDYIGPPPAGAAGGLGAPTPSAEMMRAASALGLADFALALDSTALLDSILLDRGDSLYLDSLGLVPGVDSIPARRDSLGMMRLDSIGAARYAERIRRPQVFGLEVFRRATNQFMPLTSGPVDQDYRIGPGDELALILSGEVEQAHQLPVSPEGFIVIPQVGQIPVANLTLAQLQGVLYTRLGNVYSSVRRGPSAGTRFEVMVTRIRAIQVFVTGEVTRPGAYRVTALATIMNALYQAGGPSGRGNFRAVKLMRRGQPFATLDIYDYLLRGLTRSDTRLEQGDVVFVPPLERRVTILGAVSRPGVYDLAAGEDLSTLIQMAGGLQAQAYTGRVQIQRVMPPDARRASGDQRVIDVALDSAGAPGGRGIALMSDDRVTVFKITRPARNVATVRGNVWHPGPYEIEDGMRLSDLLRRAGGLRDGTYQGRVHVSRLQPDSTRRLVTVDLSLGDSALVANDPELAPLDEVTVYALTDFRPRRQVAVYGAVQRPGQYSFTDSMTLRDAIILAGGLRDDAYLMEAEIARLPAPGEAQRMLAQVYRVSLDSSYVIDRTLPNGRPTGAAAPQEFLQPYDNVFIRRLPGFELQRNVILTGEVLFPGRYTLRRHDERISDVIERAGGLTPEAYAAGAQFFRAEGRRGRVGIELNRVLADARYRDNFILLPGDSLHVPLYESVVQVEGAVNSPVAVAYVPGHSAGYYIDRAGGFARRADKRRTYITQPNGRVERGNNRVQPGARVFVPEVPPDQARTDWPAIVQSVATVLTSIVALVVVVNR